jgi:hypothetical protein
MMMDVCSSALFLENEAKPTGCTTRYDTRRMTFYHLEGITTDHDGSPRPDDVIDPRNLLLFSSSEIIGTASHAFLCTALAGKNHLSRTKNMVNKQNNSVRIIDGPT